MEFIDTYIIELENQIEYLQLQVESMPKGTLQRIREYAYLSYRIAGKPTKDYVGKVDSEETKLVSKQLEEKKLLLMKIKVLQDTLKKYQKAFKSITAMNTFEKLVSTPIVCEDSADYGTFKVDNGQLFIVSAKTGNIIPFDICFSPENFEYYMVAARQLLKVADTIYPKGNLKGKFE